MAIGAFKGIHLSQIKLLIPVLLLLLLYSSLAALHRASAGSFLIFSILESMHRITPQWYPHLLWPVAIPYSIVVLDLPRCSSDEFHNKACLVASSRGLFSLKRWPINFQSLPEGCCLEPRRRLDENAGSPRKRLLKIENVCRPMRLFRLQSVSSPTVLSYRGVCLE